MCKSYLLITANLGFKNQVEDALRKLEGTVDDVHLLEGDFDLIAKVTTDNRKMLRKFIKNHIQRISHIEGIKTLITA